MQDDNEQEQSQGQPQKRKFLGIWFECCHVYGRLYKNKQGTEYYGRCPRCLRPVKVRIDGNSDDATNRRFFRGR